MTSKLIFVTLYIWGIVFCLLIIWTQQTWAHTQGGPPYVVVNREYADTASVVSSKLIVAQDLGKSNVLTGKSVRFLVDVSRLALPVTVVNLSKFRWNFEGNNFQEGADLTHVFNKTGSYIVDLQIENPVFNKSFQDYDLIQVNVTPKSQYSMPGAVVTENSSKNDDGDLIVNFNAQISADQTTKLKNVMWDFGDAQEATGEKVSHTYKTFADEQLVTVRVTDENGLFNDSSWKLDTQGNLTRIAVNYQEAAVVRNDNGWWLIVGSVVAAVFVGGAVVIWKLRS